MGRAGVSPGVLVAIPRRGQHFAQLWNQQADAVSASKGFHVSFIDEAPHDDAGWRSLLNGCDAVITTWGSPRFSRELLQDNTRLRVIAHAAGSIADLVTPDVYARGIQVVSANDIMAAAVAEWCLTMSLIGYSRAHRIAGFGGISTMRWDERENYRSIRTAAIGIWGYGSVARCLVAALRPLSPRSLAVCADYPCADELAASGLAEISLEDMFSTCDVIVLAAGLSPANAGRIGADLLAKIRDGATVVNCGRARLFASEDVLLAALRQERFTACLDVFHAEPLPLDHPLHRCASVIATPHVGGLGTMGNFVPDLLIRLGEYFAGQPLRGAISHERAQVMTSHTLAEVT